MKYKKALFVDLWESFYDRHAIYTIGASLNQVGVEVDYAFSKQDKKIIDHIRTTKPDLLMYSAFSSHIDLFKAFDRKIKAEFPDLFSIVGGPGVSDKAAQILLRDSSINASCVGEGDESIAHFVRTDGECQNNLILTSQLDQPQHYNQYAALDTLPFPFREPVYRRDSLRAQMPSKQFMAGRGCPYKCTYCHNHLEHELFKGSGKTIRIKSVDYLLAEMKEVMKKYPYKTAVFQDDIFFINKKWGIEFCERFPREIGVPFTCNIRSNLMDEDVARSLRDGGCIAAAWAIESGDPELRQRLLRRNMTDESIIEASELMNRFGIRHRINNVIGIPGETSKQMLKTLELNIKAKPFLSNAHIFIPFEGLDLTKYALSKNYVSPENTKKMPETFSDRSVLNFTEQEKDFIQKLSLLFPILTRFPFFYENKFIFRLLLRLPIFTLSTIYQPVHLIFWSQMYRVSSGLVLKLRILRRYFSYGA